MNSSTPTRLGIVGLGNMGRMHANSILSGAVPRLKLTAIADAVPAAAKDYPDLKFYETGSALIQSGEVDAIVIAVPHYEHTSLGIEALEAGLHVLVEKPLSVHKADCERLVAAHTNKEQIFAAMFNQRTDPKYIKLKELISSGEIGHINRIQWTITDWFRTEAYYASGGWRATWAGEGGGVLLNQCPHQLDLWQWLFGLPTEVRAHCTIGRFHDIEVEDDVTAFMRYADGTTGVFITTTGEAPGTNRLEIAAERGRLILEGSSIRWNRNEIPTSDFCRNSEEGFGKPDTWNIDIPFTGTGEQHLGIFKNFADAIHDGKPLIAPAAEGTNSVELANAMILSGLTDQTISFPLDAATYESFLMKKIEESTHVKKTKEKAPLKASDFSASF